MAKTIVGELKDLFVKFGGDTDNLTGKETTAEMIDAIEQIYEGGGNNDFVVTYTMNTETETITADKTFAEITAAIEDGKSVKAVVSGMPLILSTVSESGVEFINVVVNNDVITVSVLTHNDEETISVKTETAGGSNDFVVTYTMSGEGTATADKTFADISAAIGAGKNVVAITDISSTSCYLRLSCYRNNSVVFAGILLDSENNMILEFSHATNNAVSVTVKDLS